MSTPQQHQRNQHQQQPPSRLMISAVGVNGAYGDQPAALLGGISTRLSCRRSMPGLPIRTPDQTLATPYWAASDELPLILPLPLRLQVLCQGALVNLPAVTDPAATLIVNLLPEQSFLQEEQLFRDCLAEVFPAYSEATLRQYPLQQSATAILAQVLEDFRQGPWQQLIFGASDTLINTPALLDAMQQGTCCSDLNSDRRLLGEGAAYLLIDKVAKPTPGQLELASLAHREEPNHGQAASKATSALGSCIQDCLASSGLTADQLGGIISGYVPDLPGSLEWHQTERQLWPETSQVPATTEELNPQLGCGDCGSASFPLALALAWSRFDFDFIPVTTLLVCDITAQPYRGAVCLQRVCG